MSPTAEQVTVLLFALPRELAGCDEIHLSITRPLTAGELKTAVTQQYPVLAACLTACRIVAANRYLADDQLVPHDVEVALIPPVSGG